VRFPANAVVCLSDGRIVNDDAGKGLGRAYNSRRVNQVPRPNLKTRLRRFFLGALLTVAGTAALAFGLDYGVFEIRVATNRHAYGSVTVNPYYAVLLKNGKTEFIFDPSYGETCVNALFPHAGALPCWYLSRHPDRRTDV
jgi:hypothetical protein